MAENQLYDVKGAADYLQINPQTVRQLDRSHKMRRPGLAPKLSGSPRPNSTDSWLHTRRWLAMPAAGRLPDAVRNASPTPTPDTAEVAGLTEEESRLVPIKS